MLSMGLLLSGCSTTNGSDAAQEDTIYNIVETGQNDAWDGDGVEMETVMGEAFYGQDADYDDGLAFAFVDNGDGTVTDLNTGLIWLQQPTSEEFSWEGAMDYCESLEFAGRDDWRAPSLTELFSIENFGDGWPYLDMEVFSFGDLPVDKDLQFWSSNYYEVEAEGAAANQAFGVNFGTGHIKAYPAGADGEMPPPPEMTESSEKPGDMDEGKEAGTEGGAPRGNPMLKQIWAVAGDDYGVSNYVDNGDGTVSDLENGIMWMADDSGEGMEWETALAYCEDMEYAGYDDWKLPNVKELQALVDYSGVYPAIDQSLFNITDETSYFWTSSSAYFSKRTDEQYKRYWAWYVAFGYATGPDGEDSHGAGAVRYDTKAVGGPAGEDAERIFNYVRAVRVIE